MSRFLFCELQKYRVINDIQNNSYEPVLCSKSSCSGYKISLLLSLLVMPYSKWSKNCYFNVFLLRFVRFKVLFHTHVNTAPQKLFASTKKSIYKVCFKSSVLFTYSQVVVVSHSQFCAVFRTKGGAIFCIFCVLWERRFDSFAEKYSILEPGLFLPCVCCFHAF